VSYFVFVFVFVFHPGGFKYILYSYSSSFYYYWGITRKSPLCERIRPGQRLIRKEASINKKLEEIHDGQVSLSSHGRCILFRHLFSTPPMSGAASHPMWYASCPHPAYACVRRRRTTPAAGALKSSGRPDTAARPLAGKGSWHAQIVAGAVDAFARKCREAVDGACVAGGGERSGDAPVRTCPGGRAALETTSTLWRTHMAGGGAAAAKEFHVRATKRAGELKALRDSRLAALKVRACGEHLAWGVGAERHECSSADAWAIGSAPRSRVPRIYRAVPRADARWCFAGA
jgi:hypothetical protein